MIFDSNRDRFASTGFNNLSHTPEQFLSSTFSSHNSKRELSISNRINSSLTLRFLKSP